MLVYVSFFFFQAEDGIRYLVRSRGLGDVYKRQHILRPPLVEDLRHLALHHADLVGLEMIAQEQVALSLIHI